MQSDLSPQAGRGVFPLKLPMPLRVDQAVDPLRGDGDGWSARMLRLIQRFRKSVHEAR